MGTIKNYQADLATLGIQLPKAEKAALVKATEATPIWVHFGGGNLFRGFHAKIAQDLADSGALKSGIVVAETFDEEVIDLAYTPFQNNFLQVVMKESGEFTKSLLNVVTESHFVHPARTISYLRMQAIFANPTLQLATITITEKGYKTTDSHGNISQHLKADIAGGPTSASQTLPLLTSLLYTRYLAGKYPIAMISTDNFSQNGQVFLDNILVIAKAWQQLGFVPSEFLAYLTDSQQVSFPWSMIDRITPNPSAVVAEQLEQAGIEDATLIQTKKHTNIAPFVNTEETHYLVIEDAFPNGRPPLEQAGVILTDCKTVDQADTMKVTACLNPLHTALAVFGCLLGYDSIAAEMENQELVSLIKGIGYQEGLPVVEDPKIIHPKEFIDEVIEKRLPNRMIPDTPQRIAADTSQKMPIRYGETLKKYVASPDKSVMELTYIPLTIAGWLRYLMAIDDQGASFTPSPDPLLEELQQQLAPLTLGFDGELQPILQPLLENKALFGVDLAQIGLGAKITSYLSEMLAGPGAVEAVLKKYV